jgi:1,4-alpha-glucan branching enzyme
MWQYDGWSQNGLGGIYFYNDWKAHTDWGSTRPDYGRAEVRDYIKGQIRMFLEDYKVDGFRWDSVYNIRNASGSWNQIGSDMLGTSTR